MPVRKFKPTSPGRRFMTISGFEEITTDTPEKTLIESIPTHAGRNNQGRITTRHQGGGYRKIYRKIDFKRDKHAIEGKVATIEYDPTATPATPPTNNNNESIGPSSHSSVRPAA